MTLTETYFMAGLSAVLKDKSARLYARVNSEDNFCVAMDMTADKGVMTAWGELDDAGAIAWINEWCGDNDLVTTKYNPWLKSICQAAYRKINRIK